MENKNIVVFEDDLEEEGDMVFLDEKPFTGTARLYYDSGRVEYETTYIDGFMDGYMKRFLENGELVFFSEGKGSLKHGVTREWYANGKLRFEKVFELGIKLKSKVWNEKGELVEVFNLEEGSSDYEYLLELRVRHDDGNNQNEHHLNPS